MSKPERGVKRVCASCGARFFDLSHEPIVCPKCQTVFIVPEPQEPRRSGFVSATKAVARRPVEESPEGLLEPDEEETLPAPEEDEETAQAVDKDEGEDEDEEALRGLDDVEESDLGPDDRSDEE